MRINRVDQIGTHCVPRVDQQVHSQGRIATWQRQAPHLDAANAAASVP
jgi:hypothetical protein